MFNVIHTYTVRAVIEAHATKEEATRAAEILQAHDDKHGHKGTYTVEEV